MFDIDKALRDIRPESRQPCEHLRESTRQLIDQEVRKKQGAKRTGRWAWALPVAAAMLAAFMFLFILTPAADEVSYITIDINPSVSMKVNAVGTVISVSAENDDASALLKGMSLAGLRFEEALKTVVQAADAQGYLKDDGHVLVAGFGNASGITQQQVENAVSASTQRNVTVLYLQSSKETFDKAKSHRQKPGVELLKAQAVEQGIKEQDVDDIIDQMAQKASEKKSDSNAAHQSEKDENRPTSTPNGQGQKDNSGANNEKVQEKQSTKDDDSGKMNDSSGSQGNSQDKPNNGNDGSKNNNGDNESGNAKDNKDNKDNKANDGNSQNNSQTGNADDEKKTTKQL